MKITKILVNKETFDSCRVFLEGGFIWTLTKTIEEDWVVAAAWGNPESVDELGQFTKTMSLFQKFLSLLESELSLHLELEFPERFDDELLMVIIPAEAMDILIGKYAPLGYMELERYQRYLIIGGIEGVIVRWYIEDHGQIGDVHYSIISKEITATGKVRKYFRDETVKGGQVYYLDSII